MMSPTDLLDRATARPYSLYSAAVLRIGTGLLALAYLLRDIGSVPEMWGPDAYWTPEMALRLNELNGWTDFYTIAATESPALFWLLYAAAVASAVAFTLGWRTRFTAVAFAVLLCAVQFRNTFVNDSGDHVVRLLAIYLAFTACGRVWSLDARRPALDPGERPDGLGPRLVALLHNTALLVVAAQVMIAYGSAGMYKVQGETWQQGTALHYALQLSAFRPWPELSGWVIDHELLLLGLAYLTVFAQLGLPLAVFSRHLKYPFLAALVASHAGIAVLMGLPLFSAAMVIGDAVFLPDAFWLAAARRLRAARTTAGPPPEGTAPRPRLPMGESEPEAARPH